MNSQESKRSLRKRAALILGNLNLWVALGTWALAVVAFFSLRDTMHASREQSRLTRTQIQITQVQLSPNLIVHWDAVSVTSGPGNATGWYLTPSISNTGNTKALKFTGWSNGRRFATRAQIDSGNLLMPPIEGRSPDSDILAHDRITLWSKLATVDDVNKMLAGREYFVLWVYGQYRDVWRKTPLHHLHECVIAVPAQIKGEIQFAFMEYPPRCQFRD